MDRMIAELSADIEDGGKEGKEDEPDPEKSSVAGEEAEGEEPKEPESEGEGTDEELTEQEKMDRMIAELSADIEDGGKEGKEDEPDPEKSSVAGEEARGEEPKEPEAEGEGTDEELTEQEKMDRMIAELSVDIEDGGKEGKEDEPEQEKMDSMIAELSEEDIEEIDKEEMEGQPEPEKPSVAEDEAEEEKKKDLEETTFEKKAIPDKPATENLVIGPDLHQEEFVADEDAGDKKSDENIGEWDEYEYPDIKEDDQGGKRRRNVIMWSVIAILVLGSSFVWFVLYKDVNILERPILSQRVQKPIPKPDVKDTKDLKPQPPKTTATESHVKAPQTSVSSSLADITSDHLTKSEMFEQKMQQILAVQDKLSEKRTQAVSIRYKLNEQILALKKEILAEQKDLGITSYEEAVKSPRIYHDMNLIQQLKAYTSKLAERIRYYEEGYVKMGFSYQEAEDNFKMIELWSDTKTKRLIAKMDKAMNEYLVVNKPHMFTDKQIVLDNPQKIWTEIIQSEMQSRPAGPKSNH